MRAWRACVCVCVCFFVRVSLVYVSVCASVQRVDTPRHDHPSHYKDTKQRRTGPRRDRKQGGGYARDVRCDVAAISTCDRTWDMSILVEGPEDQTWHVHTNKHASVPHTTHSSPAQPPHRDTTTSAAHTHHRPHVPVPRAQVQQPVPRAREQPTNRHPLELNPAPSGHGRPGPAASRFSNNMLRESVVA